MTNLYCGDGEIPEGKVAGSLTQCMRKGVGVGLYGVAPKKYKLTPEQIETEKKRQKSERKARYSRLGIPDLYCGDGVPEEDQKVGTRFSCMKRGIGVGLNVIAPEKYNVNYLKPHTLTSHDVYMFARKMNVPIRDENGRVYGVRYIKAVVATYLAEQAMLPSGELPGKYEENEPEDEYEVATEALKGGDVDFFLGGIPDDE